MQNECRTLDILWWNHTVCSLLVIKYCKKRSLITKNLCTPNPCKFSSMKNSDGNFSCIFLYARKMNKLSHPSIVNNKLCHIMQIVDENLLESAPDPWLGWLSVSWEINKELVVEWLSWSQIQNSNENMSNATAWKLVTMWNNYSLCCTWWHAVSRWSAFCLRITSIQIDKH